MNEQRDHIEFIEEREEEKKTQSGILRGVIDGSLLTRKGVIRQLPFILFLVIISLLYISNRYHAETLRNEIRVLRDETGELRSKAIYVSSELMKLSRQTEVADEMMSKGLELKESLEPPKKIVIEKE